MKIDIAHPRRATTLRVSLTAARRLPPFRKRARSRQPVAPDETIVPIKPDAGGA